MPRVHVPVLMINGRYDNTFPLETAARPMYDLLGTPPNRKRLVIAGGVHYVPRNVLIRETLDWFDQQLGPVQWDDARPKLPDPRTPPAAREQVYGSRIRPPAFMRALETGAGIHRLDAAQLVGREPAPHRGPNHEPDQAGGATDHQQRVPDVPRLGA